MRLLAKDLACMNIPRKKFSHGVKYSKLTEFLDASPVARAVGRPVGAKVGFGHTVGSTRYHTTVSSKPQLCEHLPPHSRKFHIPGDTRGDATRKLKFEFAKYLTKKFELYFFSEIENLEQLAANGKVVC